MPTLIPQPTVVAPAGNKPKRIEEYAGRVNSGHTGVSVARMQSPEGWEEPGPAARVRGDHRRAAAACCASSTRAGALDVRAGQAVVAAPGEWVRYSSPEPGGAEYVAICLPAFSPATVHRDA